MNIFDFMYRCLKENFYGSDLFRFCTIIIGILVIPLWPFLFYLVSRIQSLKISNGSLELNTKGIEKTSFPNLFKKKPAVLNKKDTRHKEIWGFSSLAFYLGKGKDNRHYFIGYFGNDTPAGFKYINVNCETIVGADWDNTPFWDSAYKRTKELYCFPEDNAPSYNGNGIRNGRNLHGIYACEADISEKYKRERL